jgi:restriction system protein
MKRKNESMLDDIFELLKHTPIWVGPAFAIVAFLFFRVFVPFLFPAPKAGAFDIGTILRPMVPLFAWFFSGVVLLAWIAAEFHKLFNRRLLDTRSSVASMGEISWQEFEHLVGEAYRRQGYVAQVVGNSAGDGGVDIQLTRPGHLVLVQCKQWKSFKVGVTTVREMLGVVVSRRANKGIVVTSGRFTAEARRFAESSDPPIQLIEGTELFELIRSVQSHHALVSAVESPPRLSQPQIDTPLPPTCPSCGTLMVLRTARRGKNPGSQFWGCSKYPGCRETKPLVG